MDHRFWQDHAPPRQLHQQPPDALEGGQPRGRVPGRSRQDDPSVD